MSVQSQINRIETNINAAYTAISEMGGTVPSQKTAANLSAAVKSIPRGADFPSGCIVMWSGTVDSIPSGWILCDGQNETPDLRDRFLVGAGSTYSVGDTGGSASVKLTVQQIPTHYHDVYRYYKVADYASHRLMISQGYGSVNGGNEVSSEYFQTESKGGGQSHENRPPYYALCFIMKL